eukprot:TRINITY_DN14065_c0_g1_i1.p1 TRINITY_DN14065_c0_g1~~TRINITY_DN14065_c0_g1_i1.p1  ORF type:complete len:388 (-),score=64.58 TRINITY_DN14065_c0_g1_i1:171-1334(-)
MSNSCWRNAIESLERGCRTMQAKEDERNRFAVRLANCHLESSGMQTYSCTSEMSILECTRDMNQIAFATYTDFFVITDSICFYLQSDLFQKKTEDTINALHSSAALTAHQLLELDSRSSHIVNSLEESIEKQERLANIVESVQDHISDVSGSVSQLKSQAQEAHEGVEELGRIADLTLARQSQLLSEQKELILGQEKLKESSLLLEKTLEGISYLQNTMFGQLSDIHSILFYAGVMIASFFITSTPHTSSARFFLYAGLLITFCLENFSTQTLLPFSEIIETLGLHVQQKWFFRKVFLAYGTVTVLLSLLLYRDYMKMNYRLLKKIEGDNKKIMEILEGMRLNRGGDQEIDVKQLTSRMDSFYCKRPLYDDFENKYIRDDPYFDSKL